MSKLYTRQQQQQTMLNSRAMRREKSQKFIDFISGLILQFEDIYFGFPHHHHSRNFMHCISS